MNFFKKWLLGLSLGSVFLGVAQENLDVLLKSAQVEFLEKKSEGSAPLHTFNDDEISETKMLFFGSLSFAPGGGFSLRHRKNFRGSSIDVKMGYMDFFAKGFIPMGDFNFIHYMQTQKNSLYLSYGLGVALIVPYAPFRFGYEFNSGFIDIGAKVMYPSFLPLPELRAGVGFKF